MHSRQSGRGDVPRRLRTAAGFRNAGEKGGCSTTAFIALMSAVPEKFELGNPSAAVCFDILKESSQYRFVTIDEGIARAVAEIVFGEALRTANTVRLFPLTMDPTSPLARREDFLRSSGEHTADDPEGEVMPLAFRERHALGEARRGRHIANVDVTLVITPGRQ